MRKQLIYIGNGAIGLVGGCVVSIMPLPVNFGLILIFLVLWPIALIRPKSKPERVGHFIKGGVGILVVALSGDWLLGSPRPGVEAVVSEADAGPKVNRVAFDGAGLGAWDTGLLTFLVELNDRCRDRGVAIEQGTLPDGVRRLFDLASAVPGRATRTRQRGRKSWGLSLARRASSSNCGGSSSSTRPRSRSSN